MSNDQFPSPEQLCQQAYELLLRKRHVLARERVLQAIALDPTCSYAYQTLAHVLIGMEQFSEAEECLKKGIHYDPTDAFNFSILAAVQRELGRCNQAMESAHCAVGLAPNTAQPHIQLGYCQHELKKYSEAEESFKMALRLEPESDVVHSALGRLKLTLRRFVEAEMHFRKSIELDPVDARAFNNLGVALAEQDRHRDAALCFKSAVLLDPSFERAVDNTVLTVNKYVGGGTIGVVLSVWVCAKTFHLLRIGELPLIGFWIAAALLVLVVGFAMRGLVLRRRRVKELASNDPELLKLYESIRAEKGSHRDSNYLRHGVAVLCGMVAIVAAMFVISLVISVEPGILALIGLSIFVLVVVWRIGLYFRWLGNRSEMRRRFQ